MGSLRTRRLRARPIPAMASLRRASPTRATGTCRREGIRSSPATRLPKGRRTPLDSIGAPTNAWFPGAIVSFFFPGLGLLLIGRPEYRSLGIKIFVGYVACVFGLVLFGIVTAIIGVGFVASLPGFLFPLASVASLIHTHDVTVKAYPHLGQPIFFKN